MSEESIFEDVEPMSKDSLRAITDNCRKLKFLEWELEKLEETIKQKKNTIEILSRQILPSILNESGISEIKLSTGESVSIKDKLKASIAGKNNLSAYNNMIEAEGGDDNAIKKISSLFKDQLIIEDCPEEVYQYLLDNGVPYEYKKEIHYQTLNKYCRGRIESGKKVPEGISCFEYQETSIK